MSWVDGVLEKAYYDYKLDEFLGVYKFDKEPSIDLKIHETIRIAKEYIDTCWTEWLGYMEQCSKKVYDSDFIDEVEYSTPWEAIEWFEAYFHSHIESASEEMNKDK